jgi:coronin-7
VVIGCNNGVVKIWNIPEEGLLESSDTPDFELIGHDDRISIVEFHPLASDVLTTAAMDLTIRIWDLITGQEKICIRDFSDPLFSFAWNPEGKLLATLSKDHKLKVYEPRANSTSALQEGPGTQGSRGGRVLWANEGSQIIVTGFSRVSERQIIVYSSKDISEPLATEGIDVNPAILVPFYDEGSSTLFVTGKGDLNIYAYEISPPGDGSPYIHQLSHFSGATPHQGYCLLPKILCDVRSVEFARGYRLSNIAVEPISFVVPRLRGDYFQDDLFPKARISWKPTATSLEWFSGIDKDLVYMDLRPEDMTPLSEAPAPPPTPKKPHLNPHESVPLQFEGDVPIESSLAFLNVGRDKQEKLVKSMSGKVNFINNKALPQQSYEGVDANEWDEE